MSTPRIVVIGHGMVAARLLDQLTREADAGARLDITVLGDEPHRPYNRLLLGEVVAGRADLGGLTLPEPAPHAGIGVRVCRGVAAVRVDRPRRLVYADDGSVHPYDRVVFATGAAPRIPVNSEQPHGVRALRDLDDCRELLAAAAHLRHVTVVGGGLLGIELACALRTRGLQVALAHRGDHLMDRQLPVDAAVVVRERLSQLGIQVFTDIEETTVSHTQDRLTGVVLSDGTAYQTDLVVAGAGVHPRTALAAEAGLPVRHGIVVGADLHSPADPRVAAIGDCAETPDGCPGLLAPGWEQADRLARALLGRTDQVQRQPDPMIVKLKAVGLDVLTLGPMSRPHPDARTIALHDPQGGRSVQVTVDGERVLAAVCVGAPKVAAELTVHYERGTPIPVDPALLLVSAAATAAVPVSDNPTTMPSAATVCRCNGVDKKTIVDAHLAGARDLDAIATRTRATTGCGGCREVVCGLLAWMDQANPPDPDVAQPKHDGNGSGNTAFVDSQAEAQEASR
ncbi:NAD(P)/FAD-dependent oxidoreductase [Flexivirga sp. ID2601S]|uniref:NAD(P)/FAD-dependent oxidoreductase n=1 Tax=Flexivirga aerilata TaxID=1656889 RepID=A0A849AGU5_9MICO|nr:FAD-dependent oxidoreductase [Flexivirga aerilata]NNG38786.1 NAD(P)/FAD-dependent oxidoreductase [Flexivirga aerilata]